MQRTRYFDRRGRELSKAEAFDHRGLIRDGVILRTRLSAMDNRSVGHNRGPMRITDAAGNAGLALQRPGFRCLLEDDASAHARAVARAVAYRDYEKSLCDQYKSPPVFGGDDRITGVGARGAGGSQPGDPCTCSGAEFPDDFGSPGHMQMVEGKLVCVPDKSRRRDEEDADEDAEEAIAGPTSDTRAVTQIVRDHQVNMARIYADHDRELSETWRRS